MRLLELSLVLNLMLARVSFWLLLVQISDFFLCIRPHLNLAFCCVAALSIANALHLVDQDLLGWWLSERQVTNGGLNGRPEKLADVRLSSIFTCLF